MTSAPDPFDQLLKVCSRHTRAPKSPRPAASTSTGTKVGALLSHLRLHGASSTLSLCHVVDLESRLVWGLLKGPRDRGQVRCDDGVWSLCQDYDEAINAELSAAAALLRRHGWRVTRRRT